MESILALIVLNAPKWFIHPLIAQQLVSWLLLLTSVLMVISGSLTLRRLGQPVNQGGADFHTTNLVTTGPYRYIRHPLYASLLFLAWGTLLKAVSPWTLALAGIATVALVATAKAEEMILWCKFRLGCVKNVNLSSGKMADSSAGQALNFKTLTLASIVVGFFLIPLHEFGHVLCDWITGRPAAMSYARDYLLSGGKTPFLGLLGGPSLPIILAAISVCLIYRKRNLSVVYPVAILGSVERLVLYAAGMLPSDERDLAKIMGWDAHAFKYIFLSAELVLLSLVVLSFARHRIKFKHSLLVLLIPLICFVVSAAFGVFVIERFVFPTQFKIQFG